MRERERAESTRAHRATVHEAPMRRHVALQDLTPMADPLTILNAMVKSRPLWRHAMEPACAEA
jgi:pyridoxine 5'-phosphate synthase PdxJ